MSPFLLWQDVKKSDKKKLLNDGETSAQFRVRPSTHSMRAVATLVQPKNLEEFADTIEDSNSSLWYVVGGISTILEQECRKHPAHKHSWAVIWSYVPMIVSLVVSACSLKLLFQDRWNNTALCGATEILLFALAMAWAIPLNHVMYRSKLYQEEADKFENAISNSVAKLREELSLFGYSLFLEQEDSLKRHWLLTLSEQEPHNQGLPVRPVIEGKSLEVNEIAVVFLLLRLPFFSLPMDEWTFGGLGLQLRYAQAKASNTSKWFSRCFTIPLAALSGMFYVNVGKYLRNLQLGYYVLVVVLVWIVLLFTLVAFDRLFKEWVDMKGVHAASRAIIEEASRSIVEPRSGQRMVYEVRSRACVFTKGVVRFEPVSESSGA